ncbi:MAG: GyrI-like domain-containing protein [Lachnospiraceae bacterium]|nr:GyrI-like domain-containing protein [Lachnospiraceae bacterium]
MAVKILEVKRESFPAVRLIGKKYEHGPNWGEWWQKDWFSVLEQKERLPMNGDAYIGAVHIVDGMPEYWIGMFFPVDTEVPEGFDFVDMEALEYAVCYLYDKEGSGDFYSMETHEMCLEELKSLGLKRKEDDWCFERYNCPRFTTPDEAGNVILDYGISIED